jgi:predicted Rdx family selenoprotein
VLGQDAQIEPGNAGEFTVWVEGVKVVDKAGGKFPEPAEIIAAVERAAAP